MDVLSLPDDYAWTPQEHWAWARILRGKLADISQFDPSLDRATDFAAWLNGKYDGAGSDANEETNGNPKPWPSHRQISATFLRLVLFQRPYSDARARPWVRIRAATFIDQIDWQNETFAGEFWASHCRFDREVNLRAFRVEGALALSGSLLSSALRADQLSVEGGLFCNRKFVAKGEVRLINAWVNGEATFTGAPLEKGLIADSFSVEASLFCNEGFLVRGDVVLRHARIGSQAVFSGARLEGALNADGIVMGGDLFLTDDFSAEGEVCLDGAKIDGQVMFDGATLDGGVSADDVVIKSNLFLREIKRIQSASLIGARIRGDVQLRQSAIDGVVDLTGATIEGELHLARDLVKAGPTWGKHARLILRNASVGAIAGAADSFPIAQDGLRAPMELTGLTYSRLGGLGAGSHRASSLAEAEPEQLVAWLEAGHDRQNFTPGPYRQLASALVAAGHPGKANNILHAMRLHERCCEQGWWRKEGLFLSGRAIGFGYRNHYAGFWFAAIVLSFAMLGLFAQGAVLDLSLAGVAHVGRWVGFSFGNSIPLIQLDKAHETFLAVQFVPSASEFPERSVHQVPPLIAWTFYAQKVLGFVILSFLAAGLGRAATRQRE